MLDLNQLLTEEFSAKLFKKTMQKYRPQLIELLKKYEETKDNLIHNHETNKQILGLMKGYKLISLNTQDNKNNDSWEETYARGKTLSAYSNQSVKNLFKVITKNDYLGRDVGFLDVSLKENEDILLELEKEFLFSLIDLKHAFYLKVTGLNGLFKNLFKLALNKGFVNVNLGQYDAVFSAEIYSYNINRLKNDGYFNYKGSFETTVENLTNILNTFLEEPTIESIEKYFELVYQKEVLEDFISGIKTKQIELLEKASSISSTGFDSLTLKGLPQKGKVFTLEVENQGFGDSLSFCKNIFNLFNLLNLSSIDYDKLIETAKNNPSKYIPAKDEGNPFEVSVSKIYWNKENKVKFKFNELPCFD